MSGEIVVVTEKSKIRVSMKAEHLADKGGYKFTSTPPYYCDYREKWVHELEEINEVKND